MVPPHPRLQGTHLPHPHLPEPPGRRRLPGPAGVLRADTARRRRTEVAADPRRQLLRHRQGQLRPARPVDHRQRRHDRGDRTPPDPDGGCMEGRRQPLAVRLLLPGPPRPRARQPDPRPTRRHLQRPPALRRDRPGRRGCRAGQHGPPGRAVRPLLSGRRAGGGAGGAGRGGRRSGGAGAGRADRSEGREAADHDQRLRGDAVRGRQPDQGAAAREGGGRAEGVEGQRLPGQGRPCSRDRHQPRGHRDHGLDQGVRRGGGRREGGRPRVGEPDGVAGRPALPHSHAPNDQVQDPGDQFL